MLCLLPDELESRVIPQAALASLEAERMPAFGAHPVPSHLWEEDICGTPLDPLGPFIPYLGLASQGKCSAFVFVVVTVFCHV